MRAVVVSRIGGPDVLEEREVPTPSPIPTEVLVRVKAAGINPVDWKTRAGRGVSGLLGEPPFIVGWDVSGVVEEVGGGVTRFSVGDEVFGMPWFPRAGSAYAEYVTAPSRQFALKPAALSHEQAGALPLAALTAWQALVDTAGVGSGTRVLVHAAAGGVGHLAVQIAKARGAWVAGTASGAKHAFLESIGVDQAIDYTAEDFAPAVGDVDVVIDLIGTTDYGERSLRTLRDGGLLIQVPSGADKTVVAAAEEQGKRVTGILVEPDGAALEEIAALVSEGALTAEVEETFSFADADRAHERGEQGGTTGKLVLVP